MTRLCRLLVFAAMLVAAPTWAQDCGAVANISATMGVSANRLCYGEASRGDIGCPADAPTVSGSTITGTFVGDGSGLTGVTAASADRIVSGSTQMVAYGNSVISATANKPGGAFNILLWNADAGNTSGTMTTLKFPVFNGTDGLMIQSMGASTGGFNTGNYDGFIHTNQANSYLHFAAGSQASGAVKHMTIAPNGFVGIGTTSPGAALDVRGRLDIVSGSSMVAVGSAAGYSNTSVNVLFVGLNSGQNNSGTNVTSVGNQAGKQNTGYALTAIGYGAGQSNSGTSVALLGNSAGYSNSGNYLTAVGNIAGYSNTGNNVTALGYAAGYSITADYLTAVGGYAGQTNTGTGVTAVGYSAAQSNTGKNTTAVGQGAAQTNSGPNVTAIGNGAAQYNSGTALTALRYFAGQNNARTATSSTVVGYTAGVYNSGGFLSAMGYAAGQTNTGGNVTLIGTYAG